jgi:hypothetical protein
LIPGRAARNTIAFLFALAILRCTVAHAQDDDRLRIGVAAHAFDHLGNIGDQAETAAACGANIIYAGGFGSLGYQGLPAPADLDRATAGIKSYGERARRAGARVLIGYVCATSIVKLDTFDRNWSPEFRAQFKTPPNEWLQRGRDGKPLPSWYGGDYRPACMNNPDWRAYEKRIVRLTLDAGYDGVFFDNPTVHPDGCYCEHCLRKFAKFIAAADAGNSSIESLRELPAKHPRDFLRFRATIASDFLAETRAFARSLNPKAIVTCNNSLNAPDAFYSQCRRYGYDIFEMSKVEDLVVVEDMATQPRVAADGSIIEYGPVYEMLRAIAHDKPIVAVTLAEGDYHTPPNLVRLAMAEAAAHGASYMLWPTWPAEVREKMTAAVRPEADFLREHADLLKADASSDAVLLVLPFQEWLDRADCPQLQIARTLAKENVPFRVVCEEELDAALKSSASPVVVIATPPLDQVSRAGGKVIDASKADWLATLRSHLRDHAMSAELIGAPPTLRMVVRQSAGRTVVHLLNLNVQRISSFEDRVTPVEHVRLRIRGHKGESVTARTADRDATSGPLQIDADGNVTIERVVVSTMLVID